MFKTKTETLVQNSVTPEVARLNSVRQRLAADESVVHTSLYEQSGLLQSMLKHADAPSPTIATIETDPKSKAAELLISGLTGALTRKKRNLDELISESQHAMTYTSLQANAEDVYALVRTSNKPAVLTHEAGQTEMVVPTTLPGVVMSFLHEPQAGLQVTLQTA